MARAPITRRRPSPSPSSATGSSAPFTSPPRALFQAACPPPLRPQRKWPSPWAANLSAAAAQPSFAAIALPRRGKRELITPLPPSSALGAAFGARCLSERSWASSTSAPPGQCHRVYPATSSASTSMPTPSLTCWRGPEQSERCQAKWHARWRAASGPRSSRSPRAWRAASPCGRRLRTRLPSCGADEGTGMMRRLGRRLGPSRVQPPTTSCSTAEGGGASIATDAPPARRRRSSLDSARQSQEHGRRFSSGGHSATGCGPRPSWGSSRSGLCFGAPHAAPSQLAPRCRPLHAVLGWHGVSRDLGALGQA